MLPVNKSKLWFVSVLIVICIFAGSPLLASACDADAVRVTQKGYDVNPNDTRGDSAQIQKAFDTGVTASTANTNNFKSLKLCFSAGTYLFDASVQLRRGNITIQGEWERTVFKMQPGSNVTMISIPFKIGQNVYELPAAEKQFVPENIVFERIVIDGSHNAGDYGSEAGSFFGIWVRQAKNIVLRDLIFRDFFSDALTLSFGFVPSQNASIERVHVAKVRRNGIHLGFCDNCTVRNSFINDLQNPNDWPPSAGNGIDVEVEGNNADGGNWVRRTTLDRTLFDKSSLTTESYGIKLQPAYGPLSDIAVTNNIGIHSAFSSDGVSWRRNERIVLSGNWLSFPSPGAAHVAFKIHASDTVAFDSNRLTSFGYDNTGLLGLFGVKDMTGSDNKLRRRQRGFIESVPNAAENGKVYRVCSNNALRFNTLNSNVNQNINLRNTTDNGVNDSDYRNCRVLIESPNSSNWLVNTTEIPGGNIAARRISLPITWVNEPLEAAQPPQIAEARIVNNNEVAIRALDPQKKMMRAMVLHNNFPIALKDVAANGRVSFPLLRKRRAGDQFEVRVFNEYGMRAVSSAVTN